MRKIYTFLLVAFVITLFNSNASAQAVDTVKYEFCKIRSTSVDQNTSADAAGKIKVTQDGVARIDMDSLNDLTHSVIDSAFIRISVGAVVPGWFDFYEMDADWLFAEITWTSAEDYNLVTTPFDSVYFDVSETTYLVDITEYLKAKITANTDFAYRLIARGDGSAYAHFTANTTPLRQPSIII